jgi:hypothetical protein
MKRNIFILLTTLLTLTLPIWAQVNNGKGKNEKLPRKVEQNRPTGNLTVRINEVVKEDANAKNVADGRLIPVRFVWLCGSTGNAKLMELEARLITLNTDGKQTVVTKRLVDWTVNKPITSVIDLPMAKDVFAKSFRLELVGKFHDGVVERAVSAVKQGNFPLPNATAQKR